jgi:hypothetical protein
VSEHFQGAPVDDTALRASIAWVEEVDGVPVEDEQEQVLSAQPSHGSRAIERRGGAVLPAAAAAAVAAGGFVAGAAVLTLVHRRSARRPALPRPRSAGRQLGRRGPQAPAPQVLQVLSTRSLLVDIHVLGPAGPTST